MPDTVELVHYAVVDAVATITLDSPHNRNALSRQLVSELSEQRLRRTEALTGEQVIELTAEELLV